MEKQNTTHEHAARGTCEHETFLLDWGALLMALESSDWQVTVEQPPCQDGKESWGARHVLRWGLRSSWGAGIRTRVSVHPSWLHDLG
jgi:hypothetical protein